MSHVAAAKGSLLAAGRQHSQTQIPVPKKLMAPAQPQQLHLVGPRPFGTSSVAARAQMFQNNNSGSSTNSNTNNNHPAHSPNPSSNGFGGQHARTGSSGSSNGLVSPSRPTANPPGSAPPRPPTFTSTCSFTNGGTGNSPLSPGVAGTDKWKVKYEEAERKRKALLTTSEKSAREAADLQRRLQQLQRDHDVTRSELKDKEDKLAQLRAVSERVYKEYDQLKNRYEVETGAMHQAMQRATEWYKQNRELKRRSTAIMQKFIQVQPDGALLDLLADETDAAQAAKDGDDLEDLRNTVTRLSGEVARLQSELNSARLQEFEAQEAAMTASAELDEARRAQEELAELRALRNNMTAAADLLRREVAALRDQCDLERQAARRMQSQADKAVKERNVLAHQSSLLAEALAQDDRLLPLLAEVESLKRLLEEERARVWELQQQDGLHDEHQEELLAERLRIAEEQLSITAARAERSEREGQQLRDRLSELERELEERRTALPPPPAAPPLPPPPPPPPLPNGTPVASSVASPVKLRLRGAGSGSGEVGTGTGATSSENQANNSAVQDMANLLGIPRKPQVPEAIPGGAIDNIINQIKGGRFTLKATEQNLQKEKKEEKPAAVAEMLNILGTLRRRPREPVINSPSPAAAPKDVAL